MRARAASVAVTLAFIAVLVLALPAAALAEDPPSNPATLTAAHLTLVAPATIAAKASAYATATLTDATGTPLPGRAVVIQRTYPSPSVLATGLTDAGGHFRVRVAPISRIVLRARFDGDETYEATASASVTIKPCVLLGKPWTHDTFAYPGQWLPARGALWPAHSKYATSTVIVCQRLESGTWVTRKRFSARIVNTNGTSRYVGKFKLPSTGTWRVRAMHEDSNHARTWGPTQHISCTNWRARYMGKRLHGFVAPSKMVAITIDDGPNFRTLNICSILERYGARGTFFFTSLLLRSGFIGQARKAYDRGHEIANHTARHDALTRSYAFDYNSVMTAKRTIREATGFAPIWVRPMGGGINSTGVRAINNSDELCAIWSIDSYDSHARYTSPNTLYHNVVDHVRSGDVILIHQTHPESVEALPRICRTLKARGYKMVTLSRLASLSHKR